MHLFTASFLSELISELNRSWDLYDITNIHKAQMKHTEFWVKSYITAHDGSWPNGVTFSMMVYLVLMQVMLVSVHLKVN